MKAEFEMSGGNVFADLGFENPDLELIKAKLVLQIFRLIRDRNLSQSEAARLLGTTQPLVSSLMRNKPVSVSVGRLMEFLIALGQDIEVVLRPALNEGQVGQRTLRLAHDAA